MVAITQKKKIVTLFELGRDIPYGDIGSRDPMAVLKIRKGTCSGKHFVLGYMLEKMGVEI